MYIIFCPPAFKKLLIWFFNTKNINSFANFSSKLGNWCQGTKNYIYIKPFILKTFLALYINIWDILQLKEAVYNLLNIIWNWVFSFKLLCLIGESFDDYSDDVCGAVVNVRAKGDKIAIWTTECENREAVTHIG